MDSMPRVSLATLNATSAEEFGAALTGIWEHSPWVAGAAAARRPFPNVESLLAAMNEVVATAPPDQQLALLRAHPDLAGRLARSGGLTAESTSEQAFAGLDRLSDEEYAQFSAWNATYRERFGFPFIICVREHRKATIREAFERRLTNGPDEERRTALVEVQKIASLRLRERVIP